MVGHGWHSLAMDGLALFGVKHPWLTLARAMAAVLAVAFVYRFRKDAGVR